MTLGSALLMFFFNKTSKNQTNAIQNKYHQIFL